MTIELALLGPLELRVGGEPVATGGPRQRTVLAVLGLEAGSVVSADRLADAVWGEDAFDRDRGTLQVYVSNLRRALGPDGRAAIVTQDPGYRLDPTVVTVDSAEFGRLAREGHAATAEGRAAEAVELLREADALWRGELLADLVDVHHLQPWREQYQERRLAAIEDRIEAELVAGHHAAVQGELRGLVDQHPFRERLWGQLMLALYRSGRQADALRAFGEARDRLTEEIGVDPGPALQRLERSILLQSPSIELGTADRPALHWLDPDGRPQRRALESRVLMIGRADDSEVAVPWDDTVSRYHAVVMPDGDGWAVADRDSRNGTFLNGERVTTSVPLADGDLLRCGATAILVHTGQGPTRSRPAAPASLDTRTVELER